MMPEATTRQEYNRMASVYDWIWRSYLKQTLSFLKTWANLPPEAVVLDIACGTGLFEQAVLEEHPTQTFVASDVSQNMLDVAAQRLDAFPSVTLLAASASALPFASELFDVVVCASALHYFDSPQTALFEMRRVARAGGSIIILDWCRDFPTMRVLDAILRHTEPAHQRCYTLDELQAMLAENGLAVQMSQRVRFGLFWGLMVVAAQ